MVGAVGGVVDSAGVANFASSCSSSGCDSAGGGAGSKGTTGKHVYNNFENKENNGCCCCWWLCERVKKNDVMLRTEKKTGCKLVDRLIEN